MAAGTASLSVGRADRRWRVVGAADLGGDVAWGQGPHLLEPVQRHRQRPGDGDPGRGAKGDQVAWTAWDGAPGAHKSMLLDTPAGASQGVVPYLPLNELTRPAQPRSQSQSGGRQ